MIFFSNEKKDMKYIETIDEECNIKIMENQMQIL